MTKEPIMIDGVNVSGCECYNPNIKMDCILYPLQPDACKNNPNCHYKLYKRKEQECEKLKKQYNCYACGTCNGKEDYRNLERHHIGLRKSFDELHKQLDQLKAYIKDDLVPHAKLYKQTLQEIKEISKQINKEGIYGYVITDELDKILQICDEVNE